VADAAPALLYLPELPAVGACVALESAESHYVARVCRARAGERLEATDGRGGRATLRVVDPRGEVRVEVERIEHEPPGRPAWMLCGAPEGERGDWLIEKLAELGISRFVPVETARGAWRRAAGRRERWERLAVAALRQSRRLHRMEIVEPLPLEQALGELPAGGERWLAEAAGEWTAPPGRAADRAGIGLVGPSGGLDDEERGRAIEAGFVPLRLSEARLRTETAALAWAAWWASGAPR